VCLLLRLAFLESKSHTPILEEGSLARIYVFRERLPMMHRAGWQGRRTTNPTAYAWFIWDRAHKGHPTMHRISAPEAQAPLHGTSLENSVANQFRRP
jgi:hypothetical protein